MCAASALPTVYMLLYLSVICLNGVLHVWNPRSWSLSPLIKSGGSKGGFSKGVG